MPTTEAEQNRLIHENLDMVSKIAAQYRGYKGVPFDDLVAEGMLGLVAAARMWEPIAAFPAYAEDKIRGAILDFVDKWQEFVPLGDTSEAEDLLQWWDIWSDIPYEGWTRLPATPDQIAGMYDEFADKVAATEAAFLSLSRRERQMIRARFINAPYQSIDQIARDHGISYFRTIEIFSAALKKMRNVVKSIDKRAELKAA